MWSGYEDRRYKELLDTKEYKELEREAETDDKAFRKMTSLQDNAWRQAHHEAEGTPAYKEWLGMEQRAENAREAALPFIRDYQNGHYTYFDRNGEVIGEDIA